MRRIPDTSRLLLLLLTLIPSLLYAERLGRCTLLDTAHIRSLQLVAGNDPFLPPVMALKSFHYTLGFDEMSHEYHRYIYHIDHCDANWKVSDGLFESNFLDGLNDQPIEDYEKSFNTTQIYTHYSVDFPNEQTQLLLSGNYRITVYDDDDDEKTPLLTVEFSLVEPQTDIQATVDGNTDIDFQREHQQVNITLRYGSLKVTDPDRELRTFVIQNRRPDRCVEVKPNIRKAGGVEYTHQRSLIFPASNEYRKFELLDVHRANLNVDNIRWFDPYYHVTLYEEKPLQHYVYDEDANGGYVMRNADNEDNETTCEYAIVHFRLLSPLLPGGDVFLQGEWCHNWPDDIYRMTYNKEAGEYEAAILLKQGYYNYRFVQLTGEQTPAGVPIATTRNTDGNFYQTRNEYIIMVYYKEPGGRYDRLVGMKAIEN